MGRGFEDGDEKYISSQTGVSFDKLDNAHIKPTQNEEMEVYFDLPNPSEELAPWDASAKEARETNRKDIHLESPSSEPWDRSSKERIDTAVADRYRSIENQEGSEVIDLDITPADILGRACMRPVLIRNTNDLAVYSDALKHLQKIVEERKAIVEIGGRKQYVIPTKLIQEKIEEIHARFVSWDVEQQSEKKIAQKNAERVIKRSEGAFTISSREEYEALVHRKIDLQNILENRSKVRAEERRIFERQHPHIVYEEPSTPVTDVDIEREISLMDTAIGKWESGEQSEAEEIQPRRPIKRPRDVQVVHTKPASLNADSSWGPDVIQKTDEKERVQFLNEYMPGYDIDPRDMARLNADRSGDITSQEELEEVESFLWRLNSLLTNRKKAEERAREGEGSAPRYKVETTSLESVARDIEVQLKRYIDRLYVDRSGDITSQEELEEVKVFLWRLNSLLSSIKKAGERAREGEGSASFDTIASASLEKMARNIEAQLKEYDESQKEQEISLDKDVDKAQAA